MSNELPHASLQCSDCGTAFRLTLKKGRVPSRPVPCPKCKSPIEVSEDDVERPSESRQRIKTKPGDVLEKTKNAVTDPPTAEVLVDPPTAEVHVDPNEVDATPDPDAPPQFGILNKKKIGGKPRSARRRSTPLGVDVAKPGPRERRDNVFGQMTSSSIAIGRISTRKTDSLSKQLDTDDPDLPATPTPRSDDSTKSPKLDLSRLRSVMAKLDVDDDDDEEFKNPLDDFDLNIDDNVDDLISDARDVGQSELSLISEVEDDDDDDDVSEPAVSEPLDEPMVESEPSESEPIESDPVEESEPVDDEVDSGPIEVEPEVQTLDVDESEAYEIGETAVPARIPDAPSGRTGIGGVLVGIVLLAVVLAVFYLMAI